MLKNCNCKSPLTLQHLSMSSFIALFLFFFFFSFFTYPFYNILFTIFVLVLLSHFIQEHFVLSLGSLSFKDAPFKLFSDSFFPLCYIFCLSFCFSALKFCIVSIYFLFFILLACMPMEF